MKEVLVFREVRSKNELIPTVCHTIRINRPVSEVIQFPISRQCSFNWPKKHVEKPELFFSNRRLIKYSLMLLDQNNVQE